MATINGLVLMTAVLVSHNTMQTLAAAWPWGSVPSCPNGQQPSCHANEYYEHPTDCHYFIQCDNKQPICKECPPTLYFNVKLKVCDYAYNVPCSSKKQAVATSTTARPVVHPPVRRPFPLPTSGCSFDPPKQTCPKTEDSNSDFFLPHPVMPQCYYVCQNGVPVLRKCPATSKFNDQRQSCA